MCVICLETKSKYGSVKSLLVSVSELSPKLKVAALKLLNVKVAVISFLIVSMFFGCSFVVITTVSP